ncbi:hypothetical protein LQ318_06595 [Aliifodinibius salicampi]|uniref:Uncharacterized protein n=1 Tax=Fodinibius salicampi TaxID=1920655 RepID=A0ABT3PXL2_9BACT|nr:hypothetical protein [Fodinibius salicampi]MCW9712566.1 hypothetical protein [Fodinibius salicampi]
MQNKLLSISLIFSVFVSVAGFTIPCTLHCLQHAHMDMGTETASKMQMHHHEDSPDDECDGSCMVENVSNNSDDQNTSRSATSLLIQYRINLLAVDTNNSAIDPLYHKIYFSPFRSELKSLWISDPLVPPPQFVPTA